MQSLRDKLLKAGLVTEEQARAAEQARKQKPSTPRGGQTGEGRRPARNERADRTERPERERHQRPIAPLPPLALPGTKAHQRLEALKQNELNKKLRDIVLAAQVPTDVGAQVFYFMTRKKKLRRLELTEGQAKLLEAGELAVVERPDPAQIEHALVPKETAEELLKLSDKAVRFYNRPGAPVGLMSDDDKAGEVSTEAEPSEEAEDALREADPSTSSG
jgi:uncharacterized protein YaiL (DUF2058 family)